LGRQHLWPLIGGALMAIASFLPWVQTGRFPLAGIAGDGIFTLIGGVIVIFLAVTQRTGPVPGVIVILTGVVGGLIVGRVFRDLTSSVDNVVSGGPRAGTGLYLAGLGSLITTLTGMNLLRPKPRAIEKASPFL
jgi:hypothetical protein